MVIVIKTIETPKNIKAKGSSSDYIKSRVINGDNKNEWKRWFTPRDPLQTIDMIGCIVTGFMKKTQYNALNIKSVAKQVWFHFHESSDCSEYPKSLLKLRYPTKYLPKKIPKSKISNSKKSFDQTCQLKSGLPPLPPPPAPAPTLGRA